MRKLRGFEILPGYEELAKLPERKTALAAGYDISAALKKRITIEPGKSALIDTGLTAYMMGNEQLEIRPRSGLALKYGLIAVFGTVDADYYPEQFKVILYNTSDDTFVINPGDRIAQAIFMPYYTTDNDQAGGKRDGGFGHTGI